MLVFNTTEKIQYWIHTFCQISSDCLILTRTHAICIKTTYWLVSIYFLYFRFVGRQFMLINAYNIVGTFVRVAHTLLIYCFMFMRMFGQVKKSKRGCIFCLQHTCYWQDGIASMNYSLTYEYSTRYPPWVTVLVIYLSSKI